MPSRPQSDLLFPRGLNLQHLAKLSPDIAAEVLALAEKALDVAGERQRRRESTRRLALVLPAVISVMLMIICAWVAHDGQLVAAALPGLVSVATALWFFLRFRPVRRVGT